VVDHGHEEDLQVLAGYSLSGVVDEEELIGGLDAGTGSSDDANVVASWLPPIDLADIWASPYVPLDLSEWDGALDLEAWLRCLSPDSISTGSCPQMTPTLPGSSVGGMPSPSVSWNGSSPTIGGHSDAVVGGRYRCADCGKVCVDATKLS
jgi:hypothetical protein